MKAISAVVLAVACLMLPAMVQAGAGCGCYQPFPELEVVPHIDVLHLTSRSQGLNSVDIGLSFTGITYGRFYFLGPGIALDYYQDGSGSHASALFVANIASYVLVTPQSNAWQTTVNIQYAYSMRFRDHRLLVGFSFPLGR